MKFVLEIEVEAPDWDAIHASIEGALLSIEGMVRDAPKGEGDGVNYTFNYQITEGENK